ncbi:CoA transferase [Pollutimonas nitritireducens]|uniref:CoA transferase n=2 Tax=Pollutimonas nitritireducens TaxID=2045209 RepID=A0A2N4UGB8_9BURK|nr:CoA transferase [Pollutimonas nitritireducens]
MSGAYAGLKVVDLSQGVAGPYCARMLRENGAEVTKVEPLDGDWGRGIGFASDGLSALAIVNNLGKRSIAIDASTSNGRMLLRRLCKNADVLIESFRPGVMERLGLSWNTMFEENPRLIYVSVTAFGPTGPYAARPGSDSTLQAMSGLMQANADKDGTPKKVGTVVVDAVTGVYAAHATAAALYKKSITGQGSRVEVSLLECALAMQGNSIVDADLTKDRSRVPLSVPAGTFMTSDGFINVSSLHDRMFAGLCRAIGRDDWVTDSRFNSAETRAENASAINSMLESIFASRPSAYWEETLSREGVVCGVVKDYASMQADPQVRALDLLCEIEHCSGVCEVPRVPGSPRNFPVDPAPRVGENTVEILEELGFGEQEIQVFFEEGVVVHTPSPRGYVAN